MPGDKIYDIEAHKEVTRIKENDDLKKIFRLTRFYWPYFVFSFFFFFLLAYVYNKYTIPSFRVESTVLLDNKDQGPNIENEQILEGFILSTGTRNLENQIMLLSSRTLIDRALDVLSVDLDFYHRGLFSKLSFYPESPIRLVYENEEKIPEDTEFRFKYLGADNFKLRVRSKKHELKTRTKFGKSVKFENCVFHIELAENSFREKWLSEGNSKIDFVLHSRKKLVENYAKRLKVSPESKAGTIVRLSISGTNNHLNMDFLERLINIFLDNSLDKKNKVADRTIQFIDEQLIGISDSLVIAENKLQQFRSRNRVMDLSAQGQAIIEQAMNLENQKAKLDIEANYYSYLSQYLSKDSLGEAPIAPATMGITDPGLTRLVTDLADLQGQLFGKSLGEKNPLQSQIEQRIFSTKSALRETLNGVVRANNLAISEIQSQIRTVNAQASTLPVTERQLLGIQRKFRLNDELYNFLLEKRTVAQIQKASNMPDNEIIDSPEAGVMPVKPKKALIYLLALLSGLGIPFFVIVSFDSFNNKVREVDDVKRITNIPVIGQIPHSLIPKNTAVFVEKESQTAEAFRLLRSKIQSLTQNVTNPVILITSSIPGEGKTFAVTNLSSVISMSGKKTIIVGFDLRKPKINKSIDSDEGVSSWLMGDHDLDNVIKSTNYKNLYVIPSGQVPQNPSELVGSDKTEILIKLLKERFDYIVIDSSPVGTVSDSFHLAELADITILMVRKNVTLKNLLENTAKELIAANSKMLGIVVNDLGSEYKRYRYGGKYGYYNT